MALTTRKGAFANPSKATTQQIPPFLHKLYHMVNDPNTDSLIRWSEAGDSFYVHDHERFAKEVLPHWFKHGNFGSFVRQLNNYGFHKVPHLQQGVLRSDGETEISNFENPNFQRGQSDLLCLIQRKKQAPNDAPEETPELKEPVASTSNQVNGAETESTYRSHNIKGTVLDVNGIVNGIQAIKRHQHAISSELKDLHQSNQGLWQEAFAARERHKKHHDTITRILKFLAGVFGQTQGGSGVPHAQEMPHDAASEPSSSTAIVPRRQNRLMIENGVDLEGKAAEVLSGMHLNMDDFMEPLDFEGGQANDGDHNISERFATIETPGSPGPSTPKQESISTASNAASPQPLQSTSPGTFSQPANMAPTPSYFFPATNHNRSPSAEPSQSHSSDFLFPTETNSPALLSNGQSDQVVQNAFTTLMSNPAQLQRVLAAFQSQLPVSIPSDPGADNAHVSSEAASAPPPPFNFRLPADIQLSPSSTLSLLSAASNAGALSALPNGDDVPSFGTLAQRANQLQNSYKDAADVEADVNTLQGHIDSLIESLGLDANTTAALRGGQLGDDEIVSSTTAAPPMPPPYLSDTNPDFDFDSFLTQDFDAGGGTDVLSTSAFDAAAQQNGAERLGAFLDEVRSVSNESDVTAGSGAPDGEPETKHPAGKASRKRKSDVAELDESKAKKKLSKSRKKR